MKCLNCAVALSIAVLVLLSSGFSTPPGVEGSVTYRKNSSSSQSSLVQGVAAGIRANSRALATHPAVVKADPEVISAHSRISAASASVDSIKIFFIGNSGTDELGDGAEPLLVSAGYQVDHQKFSRPGAPLSYLWHFQNSAGRDQSPLVLMQKMWPDHLTIMPIYRSPYPVANEQNTAPVSPDYFPNPNEKQIPEPGDIRVGALFYSYAQKANPNVKLWLYSVWPNNQNPKYQTTAQWDAWVRDRQAENEVTRTGIDRVSGGKPVGIIPAGSGLAYLRERSGKSQKQFITEHFQDGVHLNATGRYFVGLLYYAAVTGQPPKLRVTDNGPLPPTLAAQYKQVAWEVINGYRWAR